MPIGATTQRFHNLKLSLGNASVPPFDPANAMLSMVPLVETIRPIATGYPSPYPRNIYGESFHTAMADELSTLVMAAQSRDYITVHTVVGEAGQAITVLQKGAQDTGSTGRAYAASLFEVAAIARLAKAQGKSYGVGAIVLTHGESDTASATFEADMVKLWQSYNQDLPRPDRPVRGNADPDVAVAAALGAHRRGDHLDGDAGAVADRPRPSRRHHLHGPEVPVRLRQRQHPPHQPGLRAAGRKVWGGDRTGAWCSAKPGSRCSPPASSAAPPA